MAAMTHLFDRIEWRDPVSGQPLDPIVTARTPSGTPISGALQVRGTSTAYPIVDCVSRLTPEAANLHRRWLEPFDLDPPLASAVGFQAASTVESFGFQWSLNPEMRSEPDLRWRVAERFGVDATFFGGKVVLDAGAGTGDQSRWLLGTGASVISVDLSDAIDVVARKLRLEDRWVGVQADVMRLPFANAAVEVVYCEGVIQHTADSAAAVRELCRVGSGGHLLATHYPSPTRALGKVRQALVNTVRGRLARMERFRLLLLTGSLAALAHVPLVGRVVVRAGLAVRSSAMPSFKTTWTNTFDTFGNHAYQRYIPAGEFVAMFGPDADVESPHPGVVRAELDRRG